MDSDFKMIEAELKKLSPEKLPEALVTRLDTAMCSWEQSVVVEDIDAEIALSELVPFGAPEDMIARLDAAMSRWHESVPVEEKVILIDKIDPPNQGVFGLRNVAAVALFGAAAALYATQERAPAPVAARPVMNAGAVSLATFQPRDTSTRILSYQEGAVISNGNGQTFRCVAVKVANEVNFLNAMGEKVTIKKPQFKFVLVPVNVD